MRGYMQRYRRIGEWLVANGLLSEEHLEEAVKAQRVHRKRFGELLVHMGFCTERDVVQCLAEQFDLPIAKPKDLEADRRAVQLLSAPFALNHLVLPLRFEGEMLHCAIADPLDIQSTDAVREKAGVPLALYIAGTKQLKSAIRKAYRLPEFTKPDKAKTKMKIDSQADRQALLDAVSDERRSA